MKSSRLASFSLCFFPLFLGVAACATAEDPSLGNGLADTRPRTDASGSDVAVGTDTGTPGTDSGGRDSSSPVDTGGAKDTGVVADTGTTDPDTGSDPDTYVDFDTGTTPDTTTGGSPCGFCTGTCPTPFSDEGCFLGCVGFGGSSGCNYDESVTPACTCIP